MTMGTFDSLKQWSFVFPVLIMMVMTIVMLVLLDLFLLVIGNNKLIGWGTIQCTSLTTMGTNPSTNVLEVL